MELLFLILRSVGLVLHVVGFVLDVNFFLVSTLVSVLLWLVAFVCSLPQALAAAALQCWDGALFSLLYLAEVVCCLVLGSLQALAGLLRGFTASLESLKVAGHLASHLVLRGREAVHRGLWHLLGSGQALLRQACEVCTIAMSLLAYLVNSVINMCLIGTQNLFALALALWDSIVSPFLRVTDLLAAFLAHVSSSAVAVAILLWSPCQLAFELLASAAKLLLSAFILNVYGLVLLGLVLAFSALVLNPELVWTLAMQASGYLNTFPSYHRLRRDMCRLYQVVLLTLGMVMSSQAWRRLADWSLQVANWSGGVRAVNPQVPPGLLGPAMGAQGRQGAAAALPRPAPPVRQGLPGASQQATGGARQVRQPPARAPEEQHGVDAQGSVAGQHPTVPGEEPSTSRGRASGKEQLNAATVEDGEDPWLLLKEQEERKKCVICQDQTKTVLLLPCRHLCLCQECTEILLQQAVYQRNCPLCRQMILHTLDVYL
ncbi:PREDICTED: RING finger protein 26 [Gavialis gangeticus]|uniref:RING finger protein 26 n=1 Tax=Gavialis gangeticus TaxID=94835 RepID=UPI00092EE612|nr:PREDICTED: RING finger protein 26 [Gavialis gangeticus]XP_019365792.1 PREDICTED: RING finger protein 26 [Gavialis gangeticus]